jgi:hypothetical protein
MRLSWLIVALGAAFLLVTGFRPGALPYVPNVPFSDAVITHWPSAVYLRESALQRRAFPVWRETIMAGQPFAANPLNKTAYPLQWLVLLVPPALHLDLMAALHLLIAGGGMWRWARALGLCDEAAGLSALAYTLTPRLVGHLGAGHLDILYAMAWWPWLMWSIRHGITHPARPLATALRTALLAALVFLADIRLSLFALSIAAVYEIAGIVQTRQWKQIYWRLLIIVPFFLLTASVLAPLLAWQPYLSRADLTPEEAGVFSLEWGNLVGLILPAHEGNFETLTYLGLPVMALAATAVIAEPRKHAFWLALAIFAGLYALGINGVLWRVLVTIEPSLLWFRVPSRAWLAVGLIASLLAGYGLQYLIFVSERISRREQIISLARARLAVVGGLAAALTCGSYTFLALDWPRTAAVSVLVGGGVLGAVLLLALGGRLRPQALALALLVLTFVDLTWTGRNWLEWRAEDRWLLPYQPLAERLLAEQPERIYSPTYSVEQQVAEAYDLRLFGGVDPFQLAGIVRAIEQGSGVENQGYSVVLPPLTGIESDEEISQANRTARPNTQVLAEWDVSHVVSSHPIEHERLELLDTVNGVYLYANQDFTTASMSDTIPAWPSNSPGLPDAARVHQLNQLTLIAALVSGVSLIACIAALLLMRLKADG